MIPCDPLLANLPAHPSLGQSVQFILVGFFFVIIVLLVLSFVTQFIGLGFREPAKPKAAAPVASAPKAEAPKTVAAPQESELDLARTAVIVAAAVHSIMGDQAHRIVSIRPAPGGWAQEGRRAIFSSHKVR